LFFGISHFLTAGIILAGKPSASSLSVEYCPVFEFLAFFNSLAFRLSIPTAYPGIVYLADDASFSLIYLVLAAILVIYFLLFLYIRACLRISRLALPDYLPPASPPNDPNYGKTSAYYCGSFIRGRRFLALPIAVLGRGFTTKGMGRIWLASESLIFQPYLLMHRVNIPYALVQEVEIRRSGRFYGKRIWRALLVITWGRRELPIESAFAIRGRMETLKEWAQEILCRAEQWKKA